MIKKDKKPDLSKIQINLQPTDIGEVRDTSGLLLAMEKNDWSDDPGTGVAILYADERGNGGYEVLNPMPFAPPIGYEPTQPIEELIKERVELRLKQLHALEEIDTPEEADDFDVSDDLPPIESLYEIHAMKPEAPDLPKKRPSKEDLEEAAKLELEYEELKERERLLRKRHRIEALEKQKQELEELYSDRKTVNE